MTASFTGAKLSVNRYRYVFDTAQSISTTFSAGRRALYDPHVEFFQRVKMSDVARTAGVSVATAYKVVNGRYGVAQATVDRVQQVIRQLGYEASLGAQSLRSHRTNVLG